MVRLTLTGVILVLALGGCASRGTAAAKAPGSTQAFVTDEQKLLACLDLRDHMVGLYADAYASRRGLSLSREERAAFRDDWTEQLAKRGTFDGFERSCFYSLTPSRYRCGMASQTADGIVACMQLSQL